MDSVELTALKLDILNFLDRQTDYETYSTGQLAWLLNEEKQEPIVRDDSAFGYENWKASVRLALWVLRKEEKVVFLKQGFRNMFYYSRKANAYSSPKP